MHLSEEGTETVLVRYIYTCMYKLCSRG